jgi:hypothetical protein
MKLLHKSVVFLAGWLLFCGGCDDSRQALPSDTASTNNGDGGTVRHGDVALTIVEPAPGARIGTSRVEVRGTIQGATQVTVGGVAADVSGGEFVAFLTFSDGPNSVVVSAGGASDERYFIVDARPPEIVIEEPGRGSFVDLGRGEALRIHGYVYDEGGQVTSLTLDGQPVSVDDGGNFVHFVERGAGVHTVVLTATDESGHVSSVSRGAIFGMFEPPEGPTWNAITLETGTEVFDVIEMAILAAIDRDQIDQLIQEYDDNFEGIEILAVEFSEVEVSLEPRNGRLRARIWIYDLRVDVRITEILGFSSGTLTGSVFADPAELSTDVYVTATPEGNLSTRLGNARASLTDFDLEIDGALDTLADWLEDWVGSLVEDALVSVVENVLVDQLFDPEVLNRSVEVLGETIETRFLVTYLAFDERGASGIADMAAPASTVTFGRSAPGVYVTAHETPFGNRRRQARVSLSDDFINKVLFQAWQGGVLDIELADLQGEDGVFPTDLTVSNMALLFGSELLDHAAGETPVSVRLELTIPPVVVMEDGQLRVDVADVLVGLFIEDGTSGTRFATVAVSGRVLVRPTLDPEGLSLDFSVEAWADLEDEPLLDLDDDNVEEVVVSLLETLPALVGSAGLESLFTLEGRDFLGLYVTESEIEVAGGYSDFHADFGVR